MSRERLDAETRKHQLLDAGLNIARKSGIRKVTRASVARACKVSDGLLNRYFDGREGLRAEVLSAAVDAKDAMILARAWDHYELPPMSANLERAVRAVHATL